MILENLPRIGGNPKKVCKDCGVVTDLDWYGLCWNCFDERRDEFEQPDDQRRPDDEWTDEDWRMCEKFN